jgi:glyoxylase-like metal-dependent hydrolase (beta-lactamase superfamily II)
MLTKSESDSRFAWATAGAYPVAPDVYRLPLPLPNDALRAVNVYAIDHGDSVTLIDGGWAVGTTTESLGRGLAEIGHEFADISSILVTHVHRDHYSNAIELRRAWGTTVGLGHDESMTLRVVQDLYAGRRTSQNPLRLRAAGASELADIMARRLAAGRGKDTWEDPDWWIKPGEQIDLPGRHLEAIATPGHTRGHLVFRDEQADAVFVGDHLLPHITPSIGFEAAPAESPLASYLTSLALMRQLPDAQLFPAHGPVTGSVHERADALLLHHERRLDATADAIRAGGSTAHEVGLQLLWTRRERKLPELDEFNQMLAIFETDAHLAVLVAQGRARKAVAEGVNVYHRV